MSMSEPPVRVRFFPLPEPLKPYCSTIYLTDVGETSVRIDDHLHPEWANIRFIRGAAPIAAIGLTTPRAVPRNIAVGPTSMATFFSIGPMRAWGVGILPLGWAKLFDAEAEVYANRIVDIAGDPLFASFAAMAGDIFAAGEDADSQYRHLTARLLALLETAPPDEMLVNRAHAALVDPDIVTVADLGHRLGISPRSVERISRRIFGFPPKLLLRRQRFLRSLGQFMLDPSMQWTRTLDPHYHDQAQFTRDFQAFMGMGARQYAALPHPIMKAAAKARMEAAGAAMQVLHDPAAIRPVQRI